MSKALPIGDALMSEIRDRFHHVAEDPIAGPRTYFENGGGSLTLRDAVDRAATFMAYPDSSSRANPTSRHLKETIVKGTADIRCFLGAGAGEEGEGHIIGGLTGTEILFRLTRTVCLAETPGTVVSSALEHPATHDSAQHWARATQRPWLEIPIDPETGNVTAEAYAEHTPEDAVLVTAIHTSHVTGMRTDPPAIVKAIRSKAPDAYVVIDGIQHAPHGPMFALESGADAYVFAPYKAFSRHGGAFGWLSERLARLPHDKVAGKAETHWDLGQPDAAMFASQSAVTDYFVWLGGHFSNATDDRGRLVAGMEAANQHETALIDRLLNGADGSSGLLRRDGIMVMGPKDLTHREGAVSFAVGGKESGDVVTALNERGVRVHDRSWDPFNSHILDAMGMPGVVRVSFAHYNTLDEVDRMLGVLDEVIG